jgi:plastocyanin
MSSSAAHIFVVVLTMAAGIRGGSIDGKVLIEKKLTRRTITSPASSYHRGTAVALASESVTDSLAFERTHVVVYLEGKLPSRPVQATIEQKNRGFTQDLLAVPIGSTVAFPNEDPIFHNVFSLSKAKTFDLGTYPKGQTRSVIVKMPGIVHVNCHLHPHMSATIVVTPNSWAIRPDSLGAFSFEDLPPGDYTVVAWHKSVGSFRQRVEVVPDGSSKVVIVIPFNEDGSVSTRAAAR